MDTILGMLGIIAHRGSKPVWSIVCNAVGSMQQLLADAVQKENLQIEIDRMKAAGITQVKFGGKLLWPLTCSFDMAWQKRAAGKCYNSPSGHALLVGGFSNKIIKCKVYSKGCTICQL